MASIGSLSDGELRHKLAEYGFPVGPVTETSRKVLIKKLKHLMVQAGRTSDVSTADKWRRSSSHFSSGEEESENEDIRVRLNSSMPPPSSNFRSLRRKSTTKSSFPVSPGRMGRRKENINLRNDLFSSPKTSTPESEPNKSKRSRFSTPSISVGNSGARRSPSHAIPPSKVFKDGFDTGSDSDVDSHKWKSNTSHTAASADSPVNVPYTSSFLSRLSSIRPKQKSDDGGGESSSVNTLLGFRKSFSSSSPVSASDNWFTSRTPSTPFQSNFVKRLSGLSPSSTASAGTPPSIYDVKECDDATISPNGLLSPSRWASLTPQSEISQEFKTTEDEGRFTCNSQLVSMVLLVVATLFFVILAVIYVSVTTRDTINFGLEDKANNFPVCKSDSELGGNAATDEICVEHQEMLPAIQLAKILHPELIQRAIDHQCSDTQTAIMTHHDAIKYVMRKSSPGAAAIYLERYIRALKILLLTNPQWGITVLDTVRGVTGDDKSSHRHLVDAGALVVAEPGLPLLCYLKLRLLGLLPITIVFIIGMIFLYTSKRAVQWYVRRRERDKLEIFNLVEQIIDVLVRHQRDSRYSVPVYVPVNHVRDELIAPSDRQRLGPLWDNAVDYIHQNESRVRCENQLVDGEETKVWRWLPHNVTKLHHSASLNKLDKKRKCNKVEKTQPHTCDCCVCKRPSQLDQVAPPRRNTKMWQGQAFDTMTGSPNSLPCSPTPCLKIRHMFDPDMEFSENWSVRIEDAVLEKCGEQNVRTLHISVDPNNREGCVYLKCASQEDAGRAYRALHGWWFDSHLVTVKYLRLERYHERFPEADGAMVYLCPSNNQKLSLQWQGPLENN